MFGPICSSSLLQTLIALDGYFLAIKLCVCSMLLFSLVADTVAAIKNTEFLFNIAKVSMTNDVIVAYYLFCTALCVADNFQIVKYVSSERERFVWHKLLVTAWLRAISSWFEMLINTRLAKQVTTLWTCSGLICDTITKEAGEFWNHDRSLDVLMAYEKKFLFRDLFNNLFIYSSKLVGLYFEIILAWFYHQK